MKHTFLRILLPTVLTLSAFSTPVFAQSAKDLEEASFILCRDTIGTAGESEACSDWIAASIATATYRSRFAEIEKYLTSDQIQRYRVNADAKLIPEKCEAMTAFELNMDILNALTNPADREKRAIRLVEWANRLAPEQTLDAALEIALLLDFNTLLARPEVRKFMEHARDLITDAQIGENETAARFLTQLEHADSKLMTPNSHALLLLHDIKKGAWHAARSRIANIDIERVSKPLQSNVIHKITDFSAKIFNLPKFSNISCYPEFKLAASDNATIAALKKINAIQISPVISGHIAIHALNACKTSQAAEFILRAFDSPTNAADSEAILNDFLSYAESQKSDVLTSAIILGIGKLSPKSIELLAKKYAPRLEKLGLETARRALEAGNADSALSILEQLYHLPGRTHACMLEYGRALQIKKNSARARQIWGEIIQNAGKSAIAEQAWLLTYRSFMAEKMTNDAQATKAQYEDAFPANDTTDW